MDPNLPIRSLGYTVIFARQMPVMREFYGTVLGFPLHRCSFEILTATSWRSTLKFSRQSSRAGVKLPMHIRRANESEAPVLSAIARESKAHWAYSTAQLAAWRDALTVSPGTISSLPTYVAEIDSRVAGFFVLMPSSPHWKLEHFWVLPSSMGHGVGKALLSHAVALAAEGGATAIAIDADPNAEKFYLACGARRVGTLAAPIEGSPGRERAQFLLATKYQN